jgi:hypothetical protein
VNNIYPWLTRWKGSSRASGSSLRSSVRDILFVLILKIIVQLHTSFSLYRSIHPSPVNTMIAVVKEQEMDIGYPTDVKHVAHIGWDSPTGSAASSPSWVHTWQNSELFKLLRRPTAWLMSHGLVGTWHSPNCPQFTDERHEGFTGFFHVEQLLTIYRNLLDFSRYFQIFSSCKWRTCFGLICFCFHHRMKILSCSYLVRSCLVYYSGMCKWGREFAVGCPRDVLSCCYICLAIFRWFMN